MAMRPRSPGARTPDGSAHSANGLGIPLPPWIISPLHVQDCAGRLCPASRDCGGANVIISDSWGASAADGPETTSDRMFRHELRIRLKGTAATLARWHRRRPVSARAEVPRPALLRHRHVLRVLVPRCNARHLPLAERARDAGAGWLSAKAALRNDSFFSARHR